MKEGSHQWRRLGGAMQVSDATRPIVIVGAGHAGGVAAALLRQQGFGGQLILLGAEPHAPYQRPPLSKAWLKGEAAGADLELRPQSFYREQQIELRLGVRALSLDIGGRQVATDAGPLDYERLILATGAAPRSVQLAGANQDSQLVLRSVADADRLKAALKPGIRLAVVGAGYVGLEVAASARALGAEVVVIEKESRVLARTASAGLAEFFVNYHRRRGVRFVLGHSVEGSRADNGVTILQLSNGESAAVEVIVAGIGAVPEDGIARAAGLRCDGGILVDHRSRTSNEYVYAIGDCTRRPVSIYGRTARLESVPSALEQARQAAADICGARAPDAEIPWFWSDQYDLKLQIAGLQVDVAASVQRGDLEGGRFAIFHLDPAGRVQCVEAVNAPQEFMAGKRLIATRRSVAPEQLSDVSISMKSMTA